MQPAGFFCVCFKIRAYFKTYQLRISTQSFSWMSFNKLEGDYYNYFYKSWTLLAAGPDSSVAEIIVPNGWSSNTLQLFALWPQIPKLMSMWGLLGRYFHPCGNCAKFKTKNHTLVKLFVPEQVWLRFRLAQKLCGANIIDVTRSWSLTLTCLIMWFDSSLSLVSSESEHQKRECTFSIL